jgi:hypothetical protein
LGGRQLTIFAAFRMKRRRQSDNDKTTSIIHHDHVEGLAPGNLKPCAGNACTHSKKQVPQIAKSIERSGLTKPVPIDDGNGIIAG